MSDRRIAGDTGAFEPALRAEIARLRKRDVDRRVMARIDVMQGEVTTEQIEQWERDAYRLWRETWPALNSLLIPHGVEDGGSAAACGCGNEEAHAPRPPASAEADAHG